MRIRKTIATLSAAGLCSLAAGVAVAATPPAQLDTGQLVELSFDELLGIEIMSVSKKAEKLRDAPAAVFVITADELRRSGARTIPDALRMVPGVQVAQIDSNKWAVTSRGFNSRFANKLLVLMDGRSVYSPTYSGVYWESQDTFLEDIDRIEVIRGPGATLWGANAVNGVINIITRTAGETQGTRVFAGAGSHDRGFGGFRHGFEPSQDTAARVYLQYRMLDEFDLVGGGDANDQWDNLQGGFRIDHALDNATQLTVQGDLYQQDIDKYVTRPTLTPPYATVVEDDAWASGFNLLGRWSHTVSADEDVQLQAYVDRVRRADYYINQSIWTWDLDFQHRFRPAPDHELVWGLGYRFTAADLSDPTTVQFDDPDHDLSVFSGFIQDTVTLVPDRWELTLGTKLEHNPFTGLEVQPSARVLFKPQTNQTLWAAVSRAVRTPSLGEQESTVTLSTIPPGVPPNLGPTPLQLVLNGTRYDESETVTAFEAGWRVQATEDLSLDLAAYYNEYDKNRVAAPSSTSVVFVPVPHVQQHLDLLNGIHGEAYGIELAADWRASEQVHLQLAYSHQRTFDHSSRAPDADGNEGSLPEHQLSIRGDFKLSAQVEANLWLRYVDRLKGLPVGAVGSVYVPAYTEADLQLTWRPRKHMEISLVGRNLLDHRHLEFAQETFTLPTEVERSVYGYLKLDF